MAILFRPDTITKYNLEENEMNCLSYFVLSNCKKTEAFSIFIRTEYNSPMMSKVALNRKANEFFDAPECKKYIQDYKNTLNQYKIYKSSENVSNEDREIWAKITTENLKYKILEIIEKNIENGVEPLDNIKLFLTKYDVEDNIVERLPIRVLAESCSNCNYKKWIDENIDLINDLNNDKQYNFKK